jgi:hypothetical protein
MKRIIIISIIVNLLYSCKEEPIGQTPVDSISPAVVTNVKSESRAGGALITYDLPEDEDLLYVKAVYELKDGVLSEAKASVFVDTLLIQGFGDTSERTVQLITVDRSKNESEPVSFTVRPDEPPLVDVQKSLVLQEAFGGINVSMENVTGANIVICLEMEDEKGNYVTLDKIYTKRKSGVFKIRGMESKEVNLRYYVSDPWDNVSIINNMTLTPMYEMRIPASRIEPMADYSTPDAWWWPLTGLFDDDTGTGFHTDIPSGLWPHHINFDIADGPIKVSRIRVIQRTDFEFQHGMPRKFTLYGSNDYPVSDETDYSRWTKLGEFESIKPSGLPLGENSDEDIQVARGGEDFEVEPNESFKYFRVDVTESWSGQNYICFMELQLWGSPDGFEFPK